MITEIKLSPKFKSQATKSIVSIVFFAICYILLLAFAVGLTILCVYLGISIIILYPRFITLAAGVGIASVGILILVFLVKFIFKSHKIDRSHLVEIKREDEEELFNLIDEIVSEVQTKFPKKVYLSSDVNASVFYNSNFWSMFFPIRKNLVIGIGLVNSITKSELKAILSHEFGHFSQRSMKIGSYVYNVNQVIFNMLYENSSYERMVQYFSGVSYIISVFVLIAVKIVEGIQWILQKLYGIINKVYMGLSREMEFHADEIAAHVTGHKPLQTSLLRLSLANFAYEQTLAFHHNGIQSSTENIYKEHSFIMKFLAEQDDIPMKNGYALVTESHLNKYNKSKLVIEDQWASHPSTEERVRHLESLQLPDRELDLEPAINLFTNPDQTQKELTEHTLSELNHMENLNQISLDEFENGYTEQYNNRLFSSIYNGYYDDKNPLPFDINTSNTEIEGLKLEELFSKEKVELIYTELSLKSDIEVLQHIANKTYDVKSFDYDGEKYKRKDSRKLIKELNTNLESIQARVLSNDQKIFSYFKALEGSGNTLKELYENFISYDKEFENRIKVYTDLNERLQFLSFDVSVDEVRTQFVYVQGLETVLKKEIDDILKDSSLQTTLNEQVRKNFELYISNQWTYFGNGGYNEENLGILFEAMNNYAEVLSDGYFHLKKRILEYQESLL